MVNAFVFAFFVAKGGNFMEKQEKRGIYYGLLVLVMVLWGSLYVANKFIMAIIPNFTLLFLRYLLAAVCLTIVRCFRDPGKAAKPIKTHAPITNISCCLGWAVMRFRLVCSSSAPS